MTVQIQITKLTAVYAEKLTVTKAKNRIILSKIEKIYHDIKISRELQVIKEHRRMSLITSF